MGEGEAKKAETEAPPPEPTPLPQPQEDHAVVKKIEEEEEKGAQKDVAEEKSVFPALPEKTAPAIVQSILSVSYSLSLCFLLCIT